MLMRTSDRSSDSANRFLRLLNPDDRMLIDHQLERVTVVPGLMLLSPGVPIEYVYFPETLMVSIRSDSGQHPGIEVAVVGPEGLIGWSGLSGCRVSAHGAIAQMRAGSALRIPIEGMRSACASSSTLLTTVMRFIEAVFEQMAQAIVSHLRDRIELRVCRWLLMRHDRIIGDHLLVKHDDISANLGVRRASVTDCLHILEGEHLIRCHRGRIVMRDRERLEALAGAAYGTSEAYSREVLGTSLR